MSSLSPTPYFPNSCILVIIHVSGDGPPRLLRKSCAAALFRRSWYSFIPQHADTDNDTEIDNDTETDTDATIADTDRTDCE